MKLHDYWLKLREDLSNVYDNDRHVLAFKLQALGHDAMTIKSQDGMVFIRGFKNSIFAVLSKDLVIQISKHQLECQWMKDVVSEMTIKDLIKALNDGDRVLKKQYEMIIKLDEGFKQDFIPENLSRGGGSMVYAPLPF